jgi:hypothetical protein
MNTIILERNSTHKQTSGFIDLAICIFLSLRRLKNVKQKGCERNKTTQKTQNIFNTFS